MGGAAEENYLSPQECRDLGSMRRSMELDQRFLDTVKLKTLLEEDSKTKETKAVMRFGT